MQVVVCTSCFAVVHGMDAPTTFYLTMYICFQFGLSTTKLPKHLCRGFYVDMSSFLNNQYSGVQLLGYVAVACLILNVISKLFSRIISIYLLPKSIVKPGGVCSEIIKYFVCSCVLILMHLGIWTPMQHTIFNPPKNYFVNFIQYSKL